MPKIIDSPEQVIVQHAREILFKEGYLSLNMRSVAKACGFSVGTIYNYFPTKKELVVKIMTEYWEDYYRILEAIDANGRDFFARLREMYMEFENFVDTFRGIWVKVNTEMLNEHTPEGIRRREDFTERLVKKLEAILSREAQSGIGCRDLSLSWYEISKFIISNFIMMAQMKQFEYNTFEKIIVKLLK